MRYFILFIVRFILRNIKIVKAAGRECVNVRFDGVILKWLVKFPSSGWFEEGAIIIFFVFKKNSKNLPYGSNGKNYGHGGDDNLGQDSCSRGQLMCNGRKPAQIFKFLIKIIFLNNT